MGKISVSPQTDAQIPCRPQESSLAGVPSFVFLGFLGGSQENDRLTLRKLSVGTA